MPTVEEELDTVTGLHMVTTLLDAHIMVDHNHQVTNNRTIHIDTNLMLHGVLVVTELSMVTEVLEDVKVSS